MLGCYLPSTLFQVVIHYNCIRRFLTSADKKRREISKVCVRNVANFTRAVLSQLSSCRTAIKPDRSDEHTRRVAVQVYTCNVC
jgi:hypothetical protein